MGCCFSALDDGMPGGSAAPIVLPTYLLWGAADTIDVTGVVEVDVLSYTLPANRIANDGDGIHIRVMGDWQNPAGNPNVASWRITWALGGVPLWQGNTTLVPASATRYAFDFDIYIARKSSTTCALGGLQHQQRSAVVPSAFGVGAMTAVGTTLDGGPASSGPVDPVVDWTVPQAVSMLLLPNAAGYTWSARAAVIETFAA